MATKTKLQEAQELIQKPAFPNLTEPLKFLLTAARDVLQEREHVTLAYDDLCKSVANVQAAPDDPLYNNWLATDLIKLKDFQRKLAFNQRVLMNAIATMNE
jgi:hypothetical protein